ncbi:MAG TPA: cell division protein ZipA C-terminal FtsZ-binding domain-containing protein, partial [Steroidobacteraceae bacterium]|nr:cell division protein ZipA C-terminal FtsZ-binding domain-containing protein [Steroidobacteraceae bacterium]
PSMSAHGAVHGTNEVMDEVREASPNRTPHISSSYERTSAIGSRAPAPSRGAVAEPEFKAPISSSAIPSSSPPTNSASANLPAGSSSPKRSVPQRKIIALRLAADGSVEGAKLKSLLEGAALVHGKYGIYHRLQGETPLFSVASMVEPGTFDPFAMSGVQFPGVTLFLQLPGAMDGLEMVSSMIACARQLEQGMGGDLQDERGLSLTEQRERRLRDDAADFLHLLGE